MELSSQMDAQSRLRSKGFCAGFVIIVFLMLLGAASAQFASSGENATCQAYRTAIEHRGAENLSISEAIVAGRGFADPFRRATGPTGWMPPFLPALLSLIHVAIEDEKTEILKRTRGSQIALCSLVQSGTAGAASFGIYPGAECDVSCLINLRGSELMSSDEVFENRMVSVVWIRINVGK